MVTLEILGLLTSTTLNPSSFLCNTFLYNTYFLPFLPLSPVTLPSLSSVHSKPSRITPFEFPIFSSCVSALSIAICYEYEPVKLLHHMYICRWVSAQFYHKASCLLLFHEPNFMPRRFASRVNRHSRAVLHFPIKCRNSKPLTLGSFFVYTTRQ